MSVHVIICIVQGIYFHMVHDNNAICRTPEAEFHSSRIFFTDHPQHAALAYPPAIMYSVCTEEVLSSSWITHLREDRRL